MAVIDMSDFLRFIGKKLTEEDVEALTFILKGYFTEDELAELVTGEDVEIVFNEENFLEDMENRQAFKEALQDIGRNDLATKFEIYLAAGSHIINFTEDGYTFICHMKDEERKILKQNVASMSRANNKDIEIHGGAGEMGIDSFKVKNWKPKCISYFNRYFKASPVIVWPSDKDIIMSTMSSVCCDSKSRGFVFKNYDIVKHMKFLGYSKVSQLGAAPTSENIYITYIEQKNVIFICEKVLNEFSMHQCSKNLVAMVKYFLTLYSREIRASGVKVIGLLIRENEKHEELVECSFCNLFILSLKDFESPATFKDFWNTIENYERWWNLANDKEQSKLFNDLAAEILCFMAVQEKGLPNLTNDRSQQFRQTYFIYTPQQMNIHFSNAKHVVIQGSYGSGKSMLGLKKLELIWKNRRQNEKIVYINFDSKSELHYVMEKNVKEYVKISSRKIKHINGIGKISEFPNHLIYLCHNSAGENLSVILQNTVRLNMNTSEIANINYHLIIEEYDGETLSRGEAAKITKLVRDGGLMKSNIILLAQPLTKSRSLSIGEESYEGETGMFHELENTFKIEKLHKVLRCSNEICGITKSMQSFFQNKESVFKINMDKPTFEQLQQPEGSEKHTVSHRVPKSNFSEVGTSAKSETSANEKGIKKADEKRWTMDLDQAFKKSATFQNNNAAKNKIVSRFAFLCEPSQGVDIEGIKPNLFEFSEDIDFTSDTAVVSLALVLKKSIDKNKTITILRMAEEQPRILRRTIQLVEKLFKKLNESFSCVEDIKEYLQKKSSKMIFSSNFRKVNGMEFDHVVIVVSQSEYYLQYYLPQVISRCTYNLTIVLLPKDETNIDEVSLQEPSAVSSRIEDDDTKETVANMIDELKRDGSVKQVVAADCKSCENSCDSSISNETDNETFIVHTHSDQYKEHLYLLKNHAESEEQAHDVSYSALAVAKINDFVLKTSLPQQPESSSIPEQGMDAGLSRQASEIDPEDVDRFLEAAKRGDVKEVVNMLNAGMEVNICDRNGWTALHLASWSNKKYVVELLLKNKADKNAQNVDGTTPLHHAARWNSAEVIRVLLQHGASRDITNNNGRTPFDVARSSKKKEAEHLLRPR